MTDSLLLVEANLELVGAAVNPEYRLGQWDLGAPEPDTTVIKSLLLDGDLISGERTGNRSCSLSIPVFAVGVSGVGPVRTALTVAVDKLLAAVNQDTFTLQWTPDGGKPILFDCSRGRGQRAKSIVGDNQGKTPVSLTFQAKPFGRSPDAQTVAAAASLQVDSFDTAPTGATLDTSTKYEGTGSASYTLTRAGSTTTYANGTPISRAYAAKNLSAYAGLSLRLLSGLSGTLTVAITLASSGGSTRYTTTLPTGSLASWTLASLSFSGGTVVGGTGVDLTAVTSEQISITLAAALGLPLGTTVTVHVDDLRAVAGSAATLTTTRGAVLLMPPILGSARTPVNLALTAGAAMDTVLVHSPPSDQDANAQILSAIAVGSAPSSDTATAAVGAAELRGTHSVVIGATNPLSGANTVSVTVTQKENGVTVATQVITRAYTAPLDTGRIVNIGEVTLPLRATASDNSLTSYTFLVNHTAGADGYQDLMLLDTRGQTVIVAPATAVPSVYVDEPSALVGYGNVLGSSAGRDRAYGIAGESTTSGGPVVFEPGVNRILTWGPAAAPAVASTSYPRWLDERVA